MEPKVLEIQKTYLKIKPKTPLKKIPKVDKNPKPY
jgi:hypothetical protein